MPTVEELQAMEAEHRNGGDPADVESPNGGMSIEDMEAAGLTPDEDGKPEQFIEGTTGQLSLSVGGRKPDSATFKMTGHEVKLVERTQFAKGSTVKLHVVVSIDEMRFRDRKDDAGVVTHTTRVHVAKPISAQRLSATDALEAAVIDFMYETESEEGDQDAALRAVVEQTMQRVRDDAELS